MALHSTKSRILPKPETAELRNLQQQVHARCLLCGSANPAGFALDFHVGRENEVLAVSLGAQDRAVQPAEDVEAVKGERPEKGERHHTVTADRRATAAALRETASERRGHAKERRETVKEKRAQAADHLAQIEERKAAAAEKRAAAEENKAKGEEKRGEHKK